MNSQKTGIEIKISFALVCIFFLLATHPSFAGETLVVGWKSWPPHQFTDERGNLKGLNIELMTAILEKANFKAEFIEVPWIRGLEWLKYGKIDIVMGGVKTNERERYAYFSDTYLKMEYNAFFIKKVDREKYKSIESLKDIIGIDFRLGVLRGGIFSKEYEQLIKRADFKKHIEEVNSSFQNIEKLMLNRIDGFISDELFGIAAIKKGGYTSKISILFYLNSEKEASAHLMFSKESMTKIQVDRINNALKEMKVDGSYEKILKTYK